MISTAGPLIDKTAPTFVGAVFCTSGKFRLAGIELIVSTLLGNQIVMVASLNDASVFHNHDYIGVLHRRQSVCNDEYSSSVHQIIHAALND